MLFWETVARDKKFLSQEKHLWWIETWSVCFDNCSFWLGVLNHEWMKVLVFSPSLPVWWPAWCNVFYPMVSHYQAAEYEPNFEHITFFFSSFFSEVGQQSILGGHVAREVPDNMTLPTNNGSQPAHCSYTLIQPPFSLKLTCNPSHLTTFHLNVAR